MKMQLDSEKKTIKIEGNVKLSDLVNHLESLLPKDCKLGYWKDYELETNVYITYWSNPIVIRDYNRPWWEYIPSSQPYYTVGDYITSSDNSYTTNLTKNNFGTEQSNTYQFVYNLELN